MNTVTEKYWLIYAAATVMTLSCGVLFSVTELKSLLTIGKVSVNASILYKNQEICNKTNLWKFQLISLFLLRENSNKCIQHFCIHSNSRSFRLARRKLIIGSYVTNYLKTITTSGTNISRKSFYHRYLYTIYVMCKSVNILVFWSYQCCAGALI